MKPTLNAYGLWVVEHLKGGYLIKSVFDTKRAAVAYCKENTLTAAQKRKNTAAAVADHLAQFGNEAELIGPAAAMFVESEPDLYAPLTAKQFKELKALTKGGAQ
jgi:hypothetical protein